jgi:hypothetical protein
MEHSSQFSKSLTEVGKQVQCIKHFWSWILIIFIELVQLLSDDFACLITFLVVGGYEGEAFHEGFDDGLNASDNIIVFLCGIDDDLS